MRLGSIRSIKWNARDSKRWFARRRQRQLALAIATWLIWVSFSAPRTSLNLTNHRIKLEISVSVELIETPQVPVEQNTRFLITLVPTDANQRENVKDAFENSSNEEVAEKFESVFNQHCLVVSLDGNESKLIIETAPHESLQHVEPWEQIIEQLGLEVKFEQVLVATAP
jgi:hypothetical protein